MLAARVEPKNGTWKRLKKPASSDLQGIALASLLAHVASSLRTQWVHYSRLSGAGFVLVSVKADSNEAAWRNYFASAQSVAQYFGR